MRLRNVKDAAIKVMNHPLVISEVNELTFVNKAPLHIEIGMGKGDFITQMAKENPQINYVGIEKYPGVLVKALVKGEGLSNLKLMCLDAGDLLEHFKVKIDCLYLNFSDPWPKKRHTKRRLTSPSFLASYEKLFIEEVSIYQKTDNKSFFAYSLVSFSQAGYILEAVSLDLANSEIPNVLTEYERKFMAEGTTINYLHATKKV